MLFVRFGYLQELRVLMAQGEKLCLSSFVRLLTAESKLSHYSCITP